MTRLYTGIVFGALLGSTAATAAPAIATFEVHDDMHAGALWRNDRPTNNRQLGAGAEMQTVVKLAGGQVLVFATASYTNVTPLINNGGLSSQQAGVLPPADAGPDGIGVEPQGRRIQVLCASYQVDPTKGLVKTNMQYLTNNNSPDWQNGHKTEATLVDNGSAAAVIYGFDPNGVNTRTYGLVVGPDCAPLSTQTQLFAGNNDDYGGAGKAGASLFSDAAGTSRVCGGHIGNGNGEDDGRAFCYTTKRGAGTGTSTFTLTPNFNISVEANEERTRPVTSATQIPNHMLDCLAAGNNRPPNRGIRCSLVNVADGVPNAERIVWRQYVVQRDGNIMYGTPSLAAIDPAAGKFILSWVRVDTTNRQGRAKGKTTIQSVPIQVAQTGLTVLDEPKDNLFGISDGAHPGMVSAIYGSDSRPVAFMFAGAITDGGAAGAKIIGLTPEGKIEGVRALNWASASSGGYTSQHYGHNPNTPQGHNAPVDTLVVDNPGYQQAGGFQPEVKTFLLVANVHHKDHFGQCTPDPAKGTNNGTCGGKNALSLHLVPVVADATNGNPNDPNDPTPEDPTQFDPGDSLGGCSTTGTGGLGTLLLIGLAFLTFRRRR